MLPKTGAGRDEKPIAHGRAGGTLGPGSSVVWEQSGGALAGGPKYARCTEYARHIRYTAIVDTVQILCKASTVRSNLSMKR